MHNKYGETTDVSKLPHNTRFYVINGAWEGKVVHKDDGVYIQTVKDDSQCLNGENQFKTTGKEEYCINIIREDLDAFCENIKYGILPILNEEFLNGRYGIDILEEYVEKRRAEVKESIEKRERSKMK